MSLGERFDSVIPAARQGADWAIEALYRDLQPSIVRYLRAHEPNEGEDLASEVWIDAARGLPRFEGGEAQFRCWMFAIARRRLIDHRRRLKRRRTAPSTDAQLVAACTRGDTEADALERLSTEAALARVAALPPDQADIILLRVVAGLDARHVAALTGRRPGTVRVLQHRGLKRLARALEREGLFDASTEVVPPRARRSSAAARVGAVPLVSSAAAVTPLVPRAISTGDEGTTLG